MSSLFSLTEQYRALQVLADSEADIPEEVIRDTLEGLGGELTVKAANVAKFIVSQEAMATAIENAAASMTERAKRLRARMDGMRGYLLANLQAANLPNIDTPEIVVKVKKNPASVVVFEEAAVPAEFMRTPPPPPPPAAKPDKAAIKQALQAGATVPGCRLEQNTRLEIKP